MRPQRARSSRPSILGTRAPERSLFINGRFLGGARTAVNAVAFELSSALARTDAGWKVKVLVPPSFPKPADGDIARVAEAFGTGDGVLWDQTQLPGARRENPQDVVAGFFNTVPLMGRGYVTMLHDAHVFRTPGSFGKATVAWRRYLSRRAAAPGNYILTVSEHSRQALLELGLGAPDRIGVVPSGLGAVGRVAPDPGIMARLGLEPHGYCVALATLLPHKNIPLLLRAFADPALAGTKLVLVGRDGAATFAAAGHPTGPNVLFPGFVSDAELAALYGSALAVCMPSTEEGFGLPALEGMAHGAPALVADRGALPEVVGDAGMILPAQDPRAWVQAIAGLSASPERRAALSVAGRRRAAPFTWDRAASVVLGHLERWFPA